MPSTAGSGEYAHIKFPKGKDTLLKEAGYVNLPAPGTDATLTNSATSTSTSSAKRSLRRRPPPIYDHVMFGEGTPPPANYDIVQVEDIDENGYEPCSAKLDEGKDNV